MAARRGCCSYLGYSEEEDGSEARPRVRAAPSPRAESERARPGIERLNSAELLLGMCRHL